MGRKSSGKEMEVIELSSDSEPEAPATKDVASEWASRSPSLDRLETPFFKAPGIVYKDDDTNNQDGQTSEQPKDEQEPAPQAIESDDKSANRKDASIEIPLPTSSELQQREVEAAAEKKTEEPPKASAQRRRITFDDSESEEFVAPKEGAASRNCLGNGSKKSTREIVQGSQDEEEDSEESDDDAPPEEVATGKAEAALLKAERATAKAAKQ